MINDANTPQRHLVFIGGSSEPGGLHIHTADIAQSCAALGCRVTILCTSTDYFSRLLARDGVAVKVIGPIDKRSWREWTSTWLSLSADRARPEIIFCCGHQGEIRIADLALARLFGAAVYTIVHRPWEGPWTFHISKGCYGRVSSKFLKRVVAVSNEIAANAADDFCIPARKIAVCLNWANPVFKVPTTAERERARQALGISPSTIVIAYLGRLAPEKRIDALLHAFAEVAAEVFSPLKLVLFGDGWKRQSLTEEAQALGIEESVHFFGWMTEPWSALRACDIFVLPSVVEGFPLALVEAMAMGCACLAHRLPSAMQLIESGRHGLLADLSDPRSFVAALRVLIGKRPTARTEMGLAAAARVATEYSRARRLSEVLCALGLTVDVAPEFRLRRLEFDVGRA